MRKHLKSVLALTVICVLVAVVLAAVNHITLPIIEQRKSAASTEGLLKVMPNGKNFAEIKDLAPYILPETVTKAYSEEGGGYVFELSTTGYASGLIIMCGVDKSGTVTGALCLSSNETNKAEITYGESFKGADISKAAEVDTVANSTKTTSAYKNAVVDAINSAAILRGESVDIRTEEEKLSDSLLEALPSADGFESEFIINKLSGVSAVYKAKNGAGYVLIYGDGLVAINDKGEVLSAVDQSVKEEISALYKKHIEAKAQEFDISGYENMPSSVEKAFKTQDGYVFELRAAGFGIKGDSYYNPSGEYIKIKVSVTAEGEIIDCVTTYQAESENYGAACSKPQFYTQFKGKTEQSFKEVDAISGATVTTTGYVNAVGTVFEALKILKGGA